MFLITNKGEFVEGTIISDEEAEIFNNLINEQMFNSHTRGYISESDAKVIASHLIQDYKLSYRNPRPVPQEPEPEIEILNAEFDDVPTPILNETA